MVNKKILLVGHALSSGGAEQIIESIYRSNTDFDMRLLMLRPYAGSNRDLKLDGGPLKILFSSADVIHTHLFWPGLLVAFRKLWDPRMNWVHTVHYADYEGQRWRRIKSWLDRKFIFPRVQRLIYVSPAAERFFSECPGDVFFNGKDYSAWDLKYKSTATGTIRIGTLANLRSEKGLLDALMAMKELKAHGLAFTYKIAGEGPCRSQLEKFIKENDLQREVELCGFVENVSEFLAETDIYFQPSISESFGLAIVDALVCGKPVIAANVGFIPELLQNGAFGKLVTRDSDFGLNAVDAIVEVAADLPRWQRSAVAGGKFWKEKLLPSNMLGQYEKLYSEMCAPIVCMMAPIVTHAKGGLQHQLFLQSEELRKHGYRIFVLQNNDPELSKFHRGNLDLKKKWRHVDFLMVPQIGPEMAKRSSLAQRFRGFAFIVGGLWKLFRHRYEISLYHCHQLYSPTIVGVIGKMLFGPTVVVKVTASGAWGELNELKKLPFFSLRKKFFRQIDRVFTLTEDMRQEVLQLGIPETKTMIVSNSVQLLDFQMPRLDFADGNLRLLFVGRLSKEKAVDTVLNAAFLLAEEFSAIDVDIVGGRDQTRDVSGDLITLSKKAPTNVKIHFHGEKKNVDEFYRSGAVFILPSQSEGMSNSLLEAMSFGCICVVSDIPSNRFLISDHENGLLFEQGNAESLARCLRELALNQNNLVERLGSNARQTIANRFSTEVIGQKIANVYQELL